MRVPRKFRFPHWPSGRKSGRTVATLTSLYAILPMGSTNAWMPTTSPGYFPWSKHSVIQFQNSRRLVSSNIFGLEPTEQEAGMKQDAVNILQSGIDAVDPYTAIRTHFRRHDNMIIVGENSLDLDDYDDIILVAFGKASSAMATSAIKQLNGQPGMKTPKISGLVICKDDHATTHEQRVLEETGIPIRYAAHPVPDERSSQAAQDLLALVEETASPATLVLCCISGGGSALFCRPRPPLTLPDLQQTNSILLRSGMGIQDMNVIRKRLEDGKGGRLAAASHPSTVVTLVLSDVLGDPLDLIASGPTVPDRSTCEDAWKLVQRNNIKDELPANVRQVIEDGANSNLEDSPSPEHPVFQKSLTVLVGNNDLAVEAAAAKADKLGYNVKILGSQVEGEAKEIAHMYVAMALYLQQRQEKPSSSPYAIASSLPVALIAGGETTVSLPSNNVGKGGRNQELALSAALQLESLGLRNVVVASVGTDGTDGPTDAAGAVVDATTVSGDTAAAEKAISNHDAYTYFSGFSSIGNGSSDVMPPLIKTGPTGTNVADVCVTLVHSRCSAKY